MMFMVILSPAETSGVYGNVEVALVRGPRRMVNGFVGGRILLRCCFYIYIYLLPLQGVEILVVFVILYRRVLSPGGCWWWWRRCWGGEEERVYTMILRLRTSL